jgi:hypothetical protein
MTNKQFLLDIFDSELCHTTWLLEKDSVYASQYSELFFDIKSSDEILDRDLELFIDRLSALEGQYNERLKSPSDWITPKKAAANELIHDSSGELTAESLAMLRTSISSKNGEKTLVSDTGKTIYFDDKWYSMIQSCGFKDIAVEGLADFLTKFIEENGWSKYFVGNIGKNDNSQIQDYHPMDTYNKNHGTSYAALHLGNTRRCVIVSVDTGTSDGRGEPRSITFLEIGAHTLIDRFDENYFRYSLRRPITEATVEELATLLDI